MRVALLGWSAPARNALGNQLVEKLEFFLERAADVRVIVQSADRLHPRLEPFCLPMPEAVPSGRAWEFLSFTDLVVADYGHYYPLLTLLPLLADKKPRIILDYHGVTPAADWSGPHRELLEKSARYRGIAWSADAVIAHSRFMCRELEQATHFPREHIKQVAFPIDLEAFSPGAGDGLRKQLGLANERVLLFVGRIAPNKRLSILIQALAHLPEPTHAVVVGDTSDTYAEEAERCRELASQLGVGNRVHFLGQLDDAGLVDAYRMADALVAPSSHEGFCLPVIEAMACGLPVIAARNTALPETVGDAGLTFETDDAADLARQVERICSAEPGARSAEPELGSSAFRVPRSALNVALVSVRYGTDFAGGAETSLRTIAETLHRAGHSVKVFTTCTRSEANWSNELLAGPSNVNGIDVERFPIDAHDRARHLETVERILSIGQVDEQTEHEYIRHSVHSRALVERLCQAAPALDAIIVGPYLFGLTHDVAEIFPEKTVVLPCFHDEPFAHFRSIRQTYASAAGLLYHSPEEQEFAQTTLAINHPRAQVIGTFCPHLGSPESSRKNERPCPERYVVYCGRYSAQKGVTDLLQYARRYSGERPGRFRFVFMGQGEIKVPRESWTQDLGFVSDEQKRDVLAHADALVQLSHLESLSLVTLEAWVLGVPVIGNAGCAAIAGNINRSGGGDLVSDYDTFAAVLDKLWLDPESGKTKGRRGQTYVRENFGSEQKFLQTVEDAISSLRVPLREQMRRRGLERSRLFERSRWKERFAGIVDEVLENPRVHDSAVEVRPHAERLSVSMTMRTHLLGVTVHNTGTQPALPEGPSRTLLFHRVFKKDSRQPVSNALGVPVPDVICPMQNRSAAIPISIPPESGVYEIALWAQRADAEPHDPFLDPAVRFAEFIVSDGVVSASSLLESAQTCLAEAFDKQDLPDDYLDVTEGAFAGLKRRIKKKLLNNFKRAYVDVLSRRQTRVNRSLIDAVRQLTDYCATLEHAVRILQQRVDQLESKLAAIPASQDELRTS